MIPSPFLSMTQECIAARHGRLFDPADASATLILHIDPTFLLLPCKIPGRSPAGSCLPQTQASSHSCCREICCLHIAQLAESSLLNEEQGTPSCPWPPDAICPEFLPCSWGVPDPAGTCTPCVAPLSMPIAAGEGCGTASCMCDVGNRGTPRPCRFSASCGRCSIGLPP